MKFIRFAAFLLGGFGTLFALRTMEAPAWLSINWGDLFRWVETTPLQDVVGAVVRLLALACAYWLVGSSLFYALARLTRLPSLIRAAEWFTLPMLRVLVDRALAVGLVASTVVAGWTVNASAATAHRSPVILTLAATPTPTPAPPLPTPPLTTPTPTPSTSPTPAPGYVPKPAGNGPGAGPTSPTQPASPNPSQEWTTHHVVSGDNFWKISAEHLANALGLGPGQISNRRTAIYWLRVVSVNRASLRSGDPNLIYPGEIVKLPPIVQPPEGGG